MTFKIAYHHPDWKNKNEFVIDNTLGEFDTYEQASTTIGIEQTQFDNIGFDFIILRTEESP